MKTKQLLTAMALPLFFAACSQEEIVNENATNDLASRKVVGEVTINLDEESMSRMAFVGGDTPYAWETGDQFGACLMDEATAETPNYNTGFWGRFTLVDYIHTNYPFTRQKDGSWTSEAVMSEGNYFFYYPFNDNKGGRRSAIKLDIPTKQVLADGAKATSALDQQLFVGYSSVQAKEGKEKESLTLKMEPLLAFPGFRLKNTGTTTVKVRKIAFHSGNQTFPIQYQVKPSTAEFDAQAYETNGSQSAATKRTNLVAIADPTTNASQVSLTFGTKGKTLKSQQTALGYIMLPPMTVSAPKLYIYTDKGLGVADLSAAHVDAGTSSGDNTTNITNDRELTTIAYNDGAIVNITFDDTALDQPLSLDIRSTDELVDLVSWSKDNTKASLVANLMNDEIALDPQVVTMLKNNKKIDLTINGDGKTLTIPANSAKDAMTFATSRLSLNVKTIKVAKNANVDVPSLPNVELVKNYGTANLVEYTTTPNLYNEGTINVVGADPDCNGYNEAVIAELENKGVVNVNTTNFANIVKFTNTYKGTANFNNGTTTVEEIYSNFNDNGNGTYSRGLMTIAKGATLNVEQGTNKGLITNNGTLKGELVNDVKNEYWASWRYLSVDSEIANNGVINGIVNNGLVEMITNEARIITDAFSEGDIDNTVQSPYVTKATNESIIARLSGELKASEIVAVVKGTNASKLYLSGTLTLDPTENKDGDLVDIKVVGQQPTLDVIAEGDLNIEGEGKLIFYADKGNTTFADFTVNAYTTTTIKTNSTIAVGNLDVNGKMLIQSGAVVVVKGTYNDANIENYGTIK